MVLRYVEGKKMQEKYTYGLWGAAGGAVLLAVLGFTWGGWVTAGTAKQQVAAAVITAAIPGCVKEVMADEAAIKELATKRKSDYDDVVRDFRKRANSMDYGYQFNRECGKAIEMAMSKSASK